MKRILLIVLAAVAVVGAAGLSVRHYNKYQNKVAQENQVRAEQLAIVAEVQKAEAEAKQARILDQYTKVRIECEKGKGYYARLTVIQRQGIQAPDSCGPAVIQ